MNNSQPNTTKSVERVRKNLGARYRAEKRFQLYGKTAIGLGLLFLSMLFISIVSKGLPAFQQTYLELEVTFDQEYVDPKGDGSLESIATGDFGGLVKQTLRKRFPEVKNRREKRELYTLASSGAAFQLRDMVMSNPGLIGKTLRVWVPADDELDMFIKGHTTDLKRTAGDGLLSLVRSGDEIKLLSTSNDFTEVLQAIKKQLDDQARQSERKLDKLRDNLKDAETNLTGLQEEMRQARVKTDAPLARAEALEASLANEQAAIAGLQDNLTREEQRFNDLRRRAETPGGSERLTSEMPSYLVQVNGGLVRLVEISNTGVSGKILVPPDSFGDAASGGWEIVRFDTPESSRRLKDNALAWAWDLKGKGQLEKRFNTTFFTAGDSREPELAGIWGAAVGSFYTLIVTLLLSFPIGVAAAIYLEEYAPKNKWTDLIEVNINNLAAVPSIVFGLLGLAVFINFFGLPRSAPLVGGLVLTLMTLPTIIIASRAALMSVPPSIREAALGVGASRIQMMTHHVLPLALPGMLTGTIIGMAQALGETAPLLMIGMVAFIVDIPGGVTDPAAVLPVQIYLWADSPERAFVERTSAAIMVLLGFLITMNILAVFLRKKFERRW
jgi:phosphate transport system permease protein